MILITLCLSTTRLVIHIQQFSPHHITNVVPLPPHPPPPYYKKYRKGTRNKCTAKFKEEEILEK